MSTRSPSHQSEERLGPFEQQELVGGDTQVHRRGPIALDKKPQTTPLPPEGQDVITLITLVSDREGHIGLILKASSL